MRQFTEIRTTFTDDNGVIHIDGYKTADDNESGTLIGYFILNEFYPTDGDYRIDEGVMEVVKELKNNDEGVVKIESFPPVQAKLYSPDGLVGTVTGYDQFNSARVQIHKGNLSGYYFEFEGEKLEVDHNGRLPVWPKGFFDKLDEQLNELL